MSNNRPDIPGATSIVRLGLYLLEENVGHGSMSVVYRAHQTLTGETVALKILKSELLTDRQSVHRFTTEGRLLSHLSDPPHPHIIGFRDMGDAQFDPPIDQFSHPYLALEYFPGLTVRQILQKKGAIPEHYVVELIAQAAEALAYAHTFPGLIHGDVTPGNIMVNLDLWHGKILDFGYARHALSTRAATASSKDDDIAGTLSYMAPEQLQAQAGLDGRADIYGLAVCMFEMLSGRPPYVANSWDDMMHLHTTAKRPSLRALVPDVSPRTEGIVDWGIELDLRFRCPSMAQFAAELRALQFRTTQ